jgi:hypothetical protein
MIKTDLGKEIKNPYSNKISMIMETSAEASVTEKMINRNSRILA